MRAGRSSLRKGSSPAGQAEDGLERLSFEGVVLVQDLPDLFPIRSGKEILEVKGDHPHRVGVHLGIRDNGKFGVETMSGAVGRDFVKQSVEQPALDEFEKRLGGLDPAGSMSSCLEWEAVIESLRFTGKLGKPVLVHAQKPCQIMSVSRLRICARHTNPSLFGRNVSTRDLGKSRLSVSHFAGIEVSQCFSIPVRDQPYVSDIGVP